MPASHQQRSKPYPGFKHDSSRCWIERWDVRMASRYSVVEVRCSTELQPEDEPYESFRIHKSELGAFCEVVEFMNFRHRMRALQPGIYTITVPGTDRKHSFEVE